MYFCISLFHQEGISCTLHYPNSFGPFKWNRQLHSNIVCHHFCPIPQGSHWNAVSSHINDGWHHGGGFIVRVHLAWSYFVHFKQGRSDYQRKFGRNFWVTDSREEMSIRSKVKNKICWFEVKSKRRDVDSKWNQREEMSIRSKVKNKICWFEVKSKRRDVDSKWNQREEMSIRSEVKNKICWFEVKSKRRDVDSKWNQREEMSIKSEVKNKICWFEVKSKRRDVDSKWNQREEMSIRSEVKNKICWFEVKSKRRDVDSRCWLDVKAKRCDVDQKRSQRWRDVDQMRMKVRWRAKCCVLQ